MQSMWMRKSWKGQFFAFSSSLRTNQASSRSAWSRSLKVLRDSENLLKWWTPSLNFSHQLSIHFQGHSVSFKHSTQPNIQPTRMILQSLVKSADKNLDGAMDWKEFEGFGDFDLVLYQRWPQMWKILRDDILSDMNTCAGGGKGSCFPSAWTTEDLKRWPAGFPSLFMWWTHFQVFLQARGDHTPRPKLLLPRRSPVPKLDSPGLVWSQNFLICIVWIPSYSCSIQNRQIWRLGSFNITLYKCVSLDCSNSSYPL